MKIETYKDTLNEHRWRARATNGQIVATGGEGYKNKMDMLDTLNTIMTELPHADIVAVVE